jgi:hypothetical protein
LEQHWRRQRFDQKPSNPGGTDMRPWAAVPGIGIMLLSAAFLPSRAAAPSHAPRLPSLSAPTIQRRETHPEINRAIKALEAARTHLRRAAHNFGGHRVQAIVAIDKAIEQLRVALQFDKK